MPAFHTVQNFQEKGVKSLHGRVDIGIIRGIKNGDLTSFERFYKILFPRLQNFVSQYVPEHKAEDLIQEAFIKVWETRAIIDEKKSLSAFVFTIVRNQAINSIRQAKNERKYIESLLVENTHQETYYLDFLTLEEKEKMHEAALAEVNRLITELPAKCQEVFVMSKIKQMKTKAIAAELDISVKAVEKHISRGYKLIRKQLR